MLFGRRLGRPLSSAKKDLLNEGDTKYLIQTSSDGDSKLNPSTFFHFTPKSLNVEIGFGAGEHLSHQCALNPNEGFIGCEPFINGACAFYQKALNSNLNNVRIYRDDALQLLSVFTPKSLDKIYVLFPDPWPKKKHHKRRLLQESTLNLFHDLLKDTGQLLIATDHVDYAEWITKKIKKTPYFIWQNQEDPEKLFPNWTETRYQRKALIQNRKAVFFHLIKNQLFKE
ncbi:MAG: tRNA (guanosine(46)-N7)-methyltransferase TrmB [Rickettsiales bacterium]|mgnify:CR=1 FL=1|nr:tRNA (guanosine(46)-N7)-methyltransferase TrmB [Rickettsiales bacterium]|tara:strand:+ start:9465 stop:10145 length:681 start_codon:yes stop_codon:yes gene_type:complete